MNEILELVRAAVAAVEGSPAESQAKSDLAELEAVAERHAEAAVSEAKDWLVKKFRWLEPAAPAATDSLS
jgi:hypothetical protein